jgi:[CysO sulfur-carrier protein]-S-L-cysteine hydrolase
MITIPRSIVDQIIHQALAELPNEACGLLAGQGNHAVRRFAMTNVDASPEHFSFDPAEQFAALRTARVDGLQLLANYHSHPVTPARPSPEDIRLAYDPTLLYLILSLAEAEPVLKAFRIISGVVSQTTIVIQED